MKKTTTYSIDLGIKHKPLQLIDVPGVVRRCREKWYNQTLCKVNDCVVRLGILRGEFHWHRHDREDEFFFVLKGKLLIDLKGKTVALKKDQGFTVPRKVPHRTRAPVKTVVLMVEAASVRPVGDR